MAALVVATAGTALVLAGAASGTLDPLGTAMGFGAALAYTAYILVGDRVVAGVPPVALAALVCTGATGTFAVAALGHGRPGARLRRGRLGLARRDRARRRRSARSSRSSPGLARVGPSAASILSTLEPVVTVGLAAAAFGEALGAVQLVGGALVLSAVVVMQWPAGASLRAGSVGVAVATANVNGGR